MVGAKYRASTTLSRVVLLYRLLPNMGRLVAAAVVAEMASLVASRDVPPSYRDERYDMR